MRVLVASIGNIFFGDDAFGCEVIRELQQRDLPSGIHVEDFGIRTYDLAYALMDSYGAVILVDATPRGETPGTVSLIEPDLANPGPSVSEIQNAHGIGPGSALRLVASMGGKIQRLYLVGCEPAVLETEELGLSPTVQAAIPQAVTMVTSLLQMLQTEAHQPNPETTQA
jgi:hydrogenase maturation protease